MTASTIGAASVVIDTSTKPASSGAAETLPPTWRGYIRQGGGRHLIGLGVSTLLLAAFGLLPLEIMRRAVDAVMETHLMASRGVVGADAVMPVAIQVAILAAAYAAFAGGEILLRLALDLYRNWIGGRIAERLRLDVTTRIEARLRRGDGFISSAAGPAATIDGVEPRVVLGDTAQLGEQLAPSLLLPLRRGAVLLAVLAYLFHLQIWMGAAVLAALVPQMLLMPLIQHAIRRREHQLSRLAAAVTAAYPGLGGAPMDGGRDNRMMRFAKLRQGIVRLQHLAPVVTALTRHLGFAALLALGAGLMAVGGAGKGEIGIGTIVAAWFGLAKIADIGREIAAWRRDRDRDDMKYRQIRDAVAWLCRPA